ncbi:MAG: hypothetical protein BWY31_01860 [Lentisphaerae bacterium ADurb.Bin242]|nr:MAG: hypothetical protein BWY31_01860 [Lentisphaerae bacterium ADurb.Bin242]
MQYPLPRDRQKRGAVRTHHPVGILKTGPRERQSQEKGKNNDPPQPADRFFLRPDHGGELLRNGSGAAPDLPHTCEPPVKSDPQALKTVEPFDFFPFGNLARKVGNGDFADLESHAQQLGGDLRLPFELVAVDGNGTDQLAVERLVAGGFVGQVRVVKQVDPVGQQQPAEEKRRCGVDTVPVFRLARAVNSLAFPVQNGPDALFVVIRIVFQIGILDDEHIPGGDPDSLLDRGTFSAVGLCEIHRLVRPGAVFLHPLRAKGGRRVRGAVVDDDDLHGNGHRGVHHLVEQRADGAFLVVHRDDDR